MAPIQLAEIRCPTLIVHRTYDNLLLYQAVFASNQIAGSQWLCVMNGSHFCAWIHPDAARTQNTIIEFLNGTPLH
jgi:pimeloyl-ACP methyl ester carboxylesterase